MKTTCAATFLALGLSKLLAQETPRAPTPAPPAVPVTAVAPSAPATTIPSAPGAPVASPAATVAAPPVVRIPTAPATVTGSGIEGTVISELPSLEPSLSGQVAWSSDAVELRAPAPLVIRSNRLFEPTGIVPRIARPERKGVGGFFSGFANLFNPFAPVEKGVESRSEYWYDGQINAAPVPFAFRDERYHEPKTEILAVGLEPKPTPTATAKH